MTAAVRYRILPKQPGAHLFEVTCTIARPNPAGQMVSLPTWIPGSYMIREFARNIVWLKTESGGKPIAAEKTDKATWRVAPCGGPLTLTYEVYAWALLGATRTIPGAGPTAASRARSHRNSRLEIMSFPGARKTAHCHYR